MESEEMHMKMGESFRRATTAFRVLLNPKFMDQIPKYKGEVFMTLRDAKTGVVQDHRHNLVVLDASILIARLMKDNAEPPNGIFCLAMGTGDVGWNPMSPPAPTTTQRSL